MGRLIALGLTFLLLVLIVAATSTDPKKTHVEWEYYRVDGFILCRPPEAPPDSTVPPCFRLPPGTTLALPKLVEGEDPEVKRKQS